MLAQPFPTAYAVVTLWDFSPKRSFKTEQKWDFSP